jgi:hypothetical protein
MVPIIIAPAIKRPRTSFPPLTIDIAAPVKIGVGLFVNVGVTVRFTAKDDVDVEVACVVEVPFVPLQEQEVVVAVTVIKEVLPEETEAEVEAEVDVTTLDDPVGVPSPPVTDGKDGAELPTAEQMASPAVLLDSTQRAPYCGWFRLSSQLPGPREVPSQRRMIGPAAQ